MFKQRLTSYKILLGICCVFAAVFSVYLYVHAGNIDSPAIPSNDAGRMYTLKNIYDYLNSVDSAVPSKPSGGFAEPASAPAGTMYTTDSIFAKLVRLPATGQTTSYPAGNGTDIDDGHFQSGAGLLYSDNGDGTITDSNTRLMWIKQSELIIPGATGVVSDNQIIDTDSQGAAVAKGNWATSTNYYVRDLIKTQQRDTGVTGGRAAKVVTAASAIFSSADIGRELIIGSSSQGHITAYISPTVVWVSTNGTTSSNNIKINSYYYCTTDHTSGTFSTDLAAGKWRENIYWATSTAYNATDIAMAQQRDAGVNGTQSGTTVTAAGATFTSADVGRFLFIGTTWCGKINAVTSSTQATVSLSQTVSSAANITIYSTYTCSSAHTSGTFSTDLGNDKWRETKWISTISTSGVPTNNLTTPFTMRWDNAAIVNCEALDYAGYQDWRLPNLKELVSIVNYGAVSPAINTTAFPNTKSDYYWSSTTYADGTDLAWIVRFSDGSPRSVGKTSAYYVRCVRGQ